MPNAYALSTRWNAFRHSSGETLIEEIVEASGLDAVELGYDLTLDLVPGVKQMVRQGVVRVNSVHNYCPVPVGAPRGHPELFLLASRSAAVRASAVLHTTRTIEFAAEIGARVVVCHAGYVEMKHLTPKLIALCARGERYSPKYEKIKTKLLLKRDARVPRYLGWLRESLDALMPKLEETGIDLALENLPAWESIPTEQEVSHVCGDLPRIRLWYDLGHGRVRENLGLIAQKHWIGKLAPTIAGFHIHDVQPPARDHMMPPTGEIDFEALADVIPPQALRVFEPAPDTPVHILRDGIEIVRRAWDRPVAAE